MLYSWLHLTSCPFSPSWLLGQVTSQLTVYPIPLQRENTCSFWSNKISSAFPGPKTGQTLVKFAQQHESKAKEKKINILNFLSISSPYSINTISTSFLFLILEIFTEPLQQIGYHARHWKGTHEYGTDPSLSEEINSKWGKKMHG